MFIGINIKADATKYATTLFAVVAFSCVALGANPGDVPANLPPPVGFVAVSSPVVTPSTAGLVAVTRMVQECTFDAFGRKTGCRMVPKIEYVDVPQRTNWTENNLTLPGAIWGPSAPTIPGVGMHSHRRTDGTIFTHSDSNQGNAAAHAGVAWPWNKVSSPVTTSLTAATYATSDVAFTAAFLGRTTGPIRTFFQRFQDWRANRPRLMFVR